MTSRLYIQLADNGNIRKWQSEPFEGGTEYVAASVLAADGRTHDEPVTASYKSDVADSATTEPDPVAYGEDIGGKIVSVRLDKSTHCIVPLYRRR